MQRFGGFTEIEACGDRLEDAECIQRQSVVSGAHGRIFP
jgi:hypothetical protein